mgnify:FL=1
MKNKNDKTTTNSNLIPRPPVEVVMGHIDHATSQLLDYIRNSNVVEKEKGGITQHIGAYEAEVQHDGKKKKITFLDTPGHEAFSQMRSRGAKIADIAVLVIAADEGVKPQTLEARDIIKKAEMPFVVALNKIDKPNAKPESVKGQLAENNIFVEGYGGNVPCASISAKTGEGVKDLLDLLLLLAEMENLRADPKGNASGVVIESNIDQKRGVSSTLLIKNGMMKKGMCIVSRDAIATVRIFEDFKGKKLEQATFSSPIRITGFNKLPEVGASFKTFITKREAEESAAADNKSFISSTSEKPEQVLEQKDKVVIEMIIKTDTAGSLEAIEKELTKLEDEATTLIMLKKGVGDINEDDARSASAANNPIIMGFNVNINASAGEIINRLKMPFFLSDIIYKISEWLEAEIQKKKAQMPKKEEMVGAAKILKTFSRSKTKQVIGGKVNSGKIIEGKKFKIKRNDFEIGEGKIINLQQDKKEVKEAGEGSEFGAMTENKIEIVKGDEIVIVDYFPELFKK